jgi:small GTP-binding protein
VEYGYKLVNINGQKVKLQIWDTAGQEKYKSITRNYYRSASMAIIVYDITSKESFSSVEKWILDVRETLCIPIMIIANKTDLSPDERVVTYQEGSNLAKRYNSQFWETSAKCKESTEYIFSLISEQLIKYNEEDLLPNSSNNKNINNNESFDRTRVRIRKKKCC